MNTYKADRNTNRFIPQVCRPPLLAAGLPRQEAGASLIPAWDAAHSGSKWAFAGVAAIIKNAECVEQYERSG